MFFFCCENVFMNVKIYSELWMQNKRNYWRTKSIT